MAKEACQRGYKCAWGSNTGTTIVCSLPKCPILHMKNVTIDKLSGRIEHRKPKFFEGYKPANYFKVGASE